MGGAGSGCGHVSDPLVMCDQGLQARHVGDTPAVTHLRARSVKSRQLLLLGAGQRRWADHKRGDAALARTIHNIGQIQA